MTELETMLLGALQDALAWIDAVPSDTSLPAMPGFDRDAVDEAITAAEAREGGDTVVVDRKTLKALKASINGECYMGAAWECDTISALLTRGDI